MADGRKNNGGARKGAGRKKKSEEEKAKALALKAIVAQFGSEEKAFIHMAKEAQLNEKEGFKYFQLLIQYAYGKPKDSIDLTSNGDSISIQIQPPKDS